MGSHFGGQFSRVYIDFKCAETSNPWFDFWYMTPNSSTLAWKLPWMEEPGRLQSMGSLRVGHDWATSLSLFTFMHWRRKWQPTLVFLPGESQGRGAWWAAIYGVAQSRTRLKWLSSNSSTDPYVNEEACTMLFTTLLMGNNLNGY